LEVAVDRLLIGRCRPRKGSNFFSEIIRSLTAREMALQCSRHLPPGDPEKLF
jgi:hypothetical protein